MRLQLRFLFASRPVITGQVLGIVYRAISMHLVKKAGDSKNTARTGAVTLIANDGSGHKSEIILGFGNGSYRTIAVICG